MNVAARNYKPKPTNRPGSAQGSPVKPMTPTRQSPLKLASPTASFSQQSSCSQASATGFDYEAEVRRLKAAGSSTAGAAPAVTGFTSPVLYQDVTAPRTDGSPSRFRWRQSQDDPTAAPPAAAPERTTDPHAASRNAMYRAQTMPVPPPVYFTNARDADEFKKLTPQEKAARILGKATS